MKFSFDMMAQWLGRRADDREVPGSSPTQDYFFNHFHVTNKINLGVKPHQNRHLVIIIFINND